MPDWAMLEDDASSRRRSSAESLDSEVHEADTSNHLLYMPCLLLQPVLQRVGGECCAKCKCCDALDVIACCILFLPKPQNVRACVSASASGTTYSTLIQFLQPCKTPKHKPTHSRVKSNFQLLLSCFDSTTRRNLSMFA